MLGLRTFAEAFSYVAGYVAGLQCCEVPQSCIPRIATLMGLCGAAFR